MPEYRRAFLPGGTFFFTVVTFGRRPIFADDRAVALLRDAMHQCRRVRPFQVNAAVVLPDHIHTIWSLPPGDSDFSARWRYLKRLFSQAYARTSEEDLRNRSRADGRWTVWQPRFWERLVRDVEEFQALADYIHYNPVRHRLVSSPRDWKASSFLKWVEKGEYSPDWGASDDLSRKRLQKAARIAGEPAEPSCDEDASHDGVRGDFP